MGFSLFSLNPKLVKSLPALVIEPSAVQRQAIPAILSGKDVLALAQTGSGKTYAFGLPILHRIAALQSDLSELSQQASSILAVVIAPTRELAAQVCQNLTPLAQAVNLRVDVLCGGEDIAPQVERLTYPAEVVVATPGRLLALAQQGVIQFELLQYLVFDEADRLLDMGFIADINALLALMPKRQTLMFSATMPVTLDKLVKTVLSPSAIRLEANAVNRAVEEINQTIYHVNKGSKAKVLIEQIKSHQWSQVLVFVNAKDDVDALCKKLLKAGINTAALHGDKEQALRSQTLNDFKAQKLNVLVATDVIARGIHIDALPVVINFDLPSQAAVYVHRIGRTARAGLSGVALSLVSHLELVSLEAIRQLTGQVLPLTTLADFPVTDQATNATSKRAPRDKQANRRTANKRSINDFSKRKPTQ
ncbi:DEAD/DEAH box helicase [Shewanella sp. OMA3-2]|uniref:DEAD/DEAH box helicase n=1 Tax=Shewanella sp. OMA3-2 TaxID=2908650 RepID=UPI001F206668|nr:DEAD/DEAH box helicase [Shewanella sp. OMA3-2]UJF21551.1 DEAD/DEAH box helicase [Shewanella sp. OMA3-2]